MSVELKKKGEKINLEKKNSQLGEIVINLNWSQGTAKKGFFSSIMGAKNIDLDLGCFYELKDGSKGVIQALGKCFGDFNNFPYISLDGDDRTGSNTSGENLRINGNMVTNIKSILIFTFIYEGIANWQQADGIVIVKYPQAEDIIVKMDDYNSSKKMCAIAMLENVNNETFSIEKIVKFFSGHEDMDKSFNWGMKWRAGKK